mmetsp:Transcript_30854/g.69701  ORF Transcript_30854/g.69701 Transcript_30854/m.69701 type:complete len:85 (-) Transcript_30854:142-396(-)
MHFCVSSHEENPLKQQSFITTNRCDDYGGIEWEIVLWTLQMISGTQTNSPGSHALTSSFSSIFSASDMVETRARKPFEINPTFW